MKNNFKKIRLQHNISIRDLADFIGLNFSAISRVETDVCGFSVDVLIRLAQFYGCSIDDLLGITDNTITLKLVSSSKHYSTTEYPTCTVVALDSAGREYHLTYKVTDKAVLQDKNGVFHICSRKFKPMAERGSLSVEKCLSFQLNRNKPLFAWTLPTKIELDGANITGDYMFRFTFEKDFDLDTF